MKTTCHIDWITLTTKISLKPIFGEVFGERVRGVSNYDYGYDTPFARYYVGSEKQGNMVVMSGEKLDFSRKSIGCTECELVGLCANFKCTRIDYAVDLYDSGITAKALESMVLSNVLRPRSKTYTLISDSLGERGDTFYIGSRKSVAKLFRGYEKSKQVGNFLDQFRLELQVGKDGGSQNAINSLLEKSDDIEVSSEIAGAVSAFLNHDDSNSVLKQALSQDKVRYKVENKTDTNTRMWLESVAIPSLLKEMRSDREFSDNVVAHINKEIGNW